MLAYSYLNINQKERDKYIHRIIPYAKFVEIIKSKRIGFVRPSKWDDPYENFLLNQEITTKSGSKKSLKELTKNIFGSCWTLNSNSDYSWRVYAPNKDGVQIKAKICDLYKAFSYLKEDNNLASFQIGRVSYLRWSKLKEKYEGEKTIKLFYFLNNLSNFEKRWEYRHEKEVRILLRYLDHDSDLLKLDLNLNNVSKTIMLDPRYTYREFLAKKNELKDLGFKGKIYRSLLYTAPKLNIQYENLTD